MSLVCTIFSPGPFLSSPRSSLTIPTTQTSFKRSLIILQLSLFPHLSLHFSISFSPDVSSYSFDLNPLPQPPYDLNQPRQTTSARLGSEYAFFHSLTISYSPNECLLLVWAIFSLDPPPLPSSTCYQPDELQVLVWSSFHLGPSTPLSVSSAQMSFKHLSGLVFLPQPFTSTLLTISISPDKLQVLVWLSVFDLAFIFTLPFHLMHLLTLCLHLPRVRYLSLYSKEVNSLRLDISTKLIL